MNEHLTERLLQVTERGWVPDFLVRAGIRKLCADRLSVEEQNRRGAGAAINDRLAHAMSHGPIALATDEANLQHYEQPTGLFVYTLGPRLKYSSCYWPDGVETLDDAETRALEVTCRHAGIEDGMEVLELGCGWGSLTLWMAAAYPACRITAISNSATQRRHIEREARQQGLGNVRVITADINGFDIETRFDRVVSVEMFEHMNNYRELLRRVAGWLREDGRLFIHVFAHRRYAYRYETEGSANWMARHFFTGGVMPSSDFLIRFQDDVHLLDRWWWSGTHYSRTAEAWLGNMNRNRGPLLEILANAYGQEDAELWYQRWRMFYLACAELWGFRNGQEWGVAHYLFDKRTVGGARRRVLSLAGC